MSVRFKNVADFKEMLSAQQKNLKEYRLVFYYVLRKTLHAIGRLLVFEAKRLAPRDTNTLLGRIDYKVEEWNHLEFGIYEDADHPPTSHISWWTKKVVPPNKKYAIFVNANHPSQSRFMERGMATVDVKKIMFKTLTEFHADYSPGRGLKGINFIGLSDSDFDDRIS